MQIKKPIKNKHTILNSKQLYQKKYKKSTINEQVKKLKMIKELFINIIEILLLIILLIALIWSSVPLIIAIHNIMIKPAIIMKFLSHLITLL